MKPGSFTPTYDSGKRDTVGSSGQVPGHYGIYGEVRAPALQEPRPSQFAQDILAARASASS